MDARLAGLAARQGGAFTAAQAQNCGYSGDEVRRRCQGGSWVTLRRGIYTTAETHARAAPEARAAHALHVAAAVLAVGPRAAASHTSAALLWRLALLQEPDSVTLTAEGVRPRSYPDLRVHAALLPPAHLGPGPLPVTSAARTVVDLARSSRFRDAVIPADSALHRGLTDASELLAVLTCCARWPGARRAARVLDFADGRSEAPSESLARVVFAELGLPTPEPQVEILDASGRVGIVDFLFRDDDTVVEVDGKMKYEQRPDNPDPAGVLWREKRREDRLRDAGYQVVRVTWAQPMYGPAEVGHRVRSAFARAQRRRTG